MKKKFIVRLFIATILRRIRIFILNVRGYSLPYSVIIEGNVTLQTLVKSNRIYGEFSLTYQGKTTELIKHNASALSVKSRLESLDTIQSVSVRRYGPDLNDGYRWMITFFSPATDLRPVS